MLKKIVVINNAYLTFNFFLLHIVKIIVFKPGPVKARVPDFDRVNLYFLKNQMTLF
jgi:hypothetical protein